MQEMASAAVIREKTCKIKCLSRPRQRKPFPCGSRFSVRQKGRRQHTENNMMTKPIHTLLLAVLTLLLAACGTDGMADLPSADAGSAPSAVYDGEWKVEGADAGAGEMAVYTSGFAFSTVPYGAILRAALPGRSVECREDGGYMVPYDNIGYSQQAVYMRLGASQWVVTAVVDGTPLTALLLLDEPLGQGGSGASATFSRVSGVYSMAFPLREVSLLDSGGTAVETAAARLHITFATIRKKN